MKRIMRVALYGICFFVLAMSCRLMTLEATGEDNAMKKVRLNYEQAKKRYMEAQTEENTVWYGRRAAYLGKYKEAIEIYTKGLAKFPESYKLYRHRGHRYISTRQFKKAITDFKKAVELVKGKPLEVEPDGIPNAANIPLSNTHFNIWYHLGLAYYLQQDYQQAAAAYRECMKWSKNDDSVTATSHWLYMTYRHMNKKAEAEKLLKPITKEMKIIEDYSYHALLLMYKGEKTPEQLTKKSADGSVDIAVADAALAYGIGNWYFYNGDVKKAKTVFEQLVKTGAKAAFGYIAAEADLARLK